jgi:hypothetical protein
MREKLFVVKKSNNALQLLGISKFSFDSARLHSVGVFSNYLETAAGHLFALGEDRMLGHYLHSGSVFLENVTNN